MHTYFIPFLTDNKHLLPQVRGAFEHVNPLGIFQSLKGRRQGTGMDARKLGERGRGDGRRGQDLPQHQPLHQREFVMSLRLSVQVMQLNTQADQDFNMVQGFDGMLPALKGAFAPYLFIRI